MNLAFLCCIGRFQSIHTKEVKMCYIILTKLLFFTFCVSLSQTQDDTKLKQHELRARLTNFIKSPAHFSPFLPFREIVGWIIRNNN